MRDEAEVGGRQEEDERAVASPQGFPAIQLCWRAVTSSPPGASGKR